MLLIFCTFIRAFLFFIYLFFNLRHEQDTSRFENLSTENIVYKTKNTRKTHRSLILDAVRGRPRAREAKRPRTTSDVLRSQGCPVFELVDKFNGKLSFLDLSISLLHFPIVS